MWAKSLEYHKTAELQNEHLLDCSGLAFRWDAGKARYDVTVPRSCIPKAPNRIRVAADGHVYTSTQGSDAGPTALLARG